MEYHVTARIVWKGLIYRGCAEYTENKGLRNGRPKFNDGGEGGIRTPEARFASLHP